MAARKPAAAKSAPATKPKANTGAKVTKPVPSARGKKAATKGKSAAIATAKVDGAARSARVARGASKKAETAPAADKAAPKSAKANNTMKAPAKKAPAQKAPAKKAAPKKTATKSATTAQKTSLKRKAEDEPPAPVSKKTKALKKDNVINAAPTQRLNVYVFGEGTAGELGLGTAKLAVDVKRPRLNPNLAADKVGVVQVAAGGMHCAALTHDNKILTWGVNDQGALGRDTKWDGGLRDMDAAAEDSDSDDEKDDNGLNPRESNPAEVDFSNTGIAEGSRWTEVAAGDSFTLAVTDDGKVYGWGTFRSNEGVFGFTPDIYIAERPVHIPDLKNIVSVKCGTNHALALDSKGAVFAWGSGQQNQLGRRVVERVKGEGLRPREFGLPKGPKNGIKAIESGPYHCFAMSKNGNVYSWGLNSFAQTGIPANAGGDESTVLKPQVIESLKDRTIVSIRGGAFHSIAATDDGQCLVWGRCDGHQLGLTDEQIEKLDEGHVLRDAHDKRRIVLAPQHLASIEGPVVHVATSGENNTVITKEGKAWSWGFSANYQTGLGTIDDVIVPTMIDNTAVREKKLNGAETGGQFSLVTAPADVVVNGA